jgi:hypothetical protein
LAASTYTKVACAKLYDRKTPITAADLLNDRGGAVVRGARCQASARLDQPRQRVLWKPRLTAGIAHETKNPLNFVNNFSGLSAELIDELRVVLKGVSFDEKVRVEIEELADTLKGKRGSEINGGDYEPTITASTKSWAAIFEAWNEDVRPDLRRSVPEPHRASDSRSSSMLI